MDISQDTGNARGSACMFFKIFQSDIAIRSSLTYHLVNMTSYNLLIGVSRAFPLRSSI